MARRVRRGFSWIPRSYNTDYTVLVDGTDARPNMLSLQFSKAIAPEISTFVLRLDNNDAFYSSLKGGETIDIQYDFGTTATTTIFLGFIEELKKIFDPNNGGHVLEIRGGHVSAVLADKTVIRSYTDSSADAIIKDLFATYFTSFTTTNVLSSSKLLTVSWNNTPFWQACAEVAKAAGFVLYVDDARDVHFFKEGSITSSTEAIVYTDTLILLQGLGTDTVEVRNRIKVSGELDGLPIIYTTNDTSSQTDLTLSFFDGIRERILEGNITSIEQAKTIGDAELARRKDKAESGKVTSWMLPTLNPGESIWITSPPQKILDKFVVAKLTHFLPQQHTICDIKYVKSISNLFRDRDLKSLSQEKISNPNDLDFSYNFSFDDDSLSDTDASDSNVTESNGQLILSSGSIGTWISKSFTTSSDVSKVQVKALGEVLQDGNFFVSADGGTHWEPVTLDALSTIVNAGKTLRLRIDFTTANLRVSSAVILYT